MNLISYISAANANSTSRKKKKKREIKKRRPCERLGGPEKPCQNVVQIYAYLKLIKFDTGKERKNTLLHQISH